MSLGYSKAVVNQHFDVCNHMRVYLPGVAIPAAHGTLLQSVTAVLFEPLQMASNKLVGRIRSELTSHKCPCG